MPIQTVKLWDGKSATHSMLQTHKMHADIANVQMWCIHKFELGTWFRRNECVSHDLKQRAGIFWYGRAFLERAVSNMCFWTCSRRSLGSVIGASIQTKLWLGKKKKWCTSSDRESEYLCQCYGTEMLMGTKHYCRSKYTFYKNRARCCFYWLFLHVVFLDLI